ncbi:thermosome subunit beta [Candidatus Borrarchaeum sp.]|uniref:thermosome subunit beta n=1 Tax=Candidatus Borrarchaeum sp. TaxID=2846742 RepID=UPI00257A6203|nr:thermosome subunit beta [Candidatus Borrarchaeum sp.]
MALNLGGVPILILKEGTERTTKRKAQMNNIAAGKVIAEAVKSALGPRGMDKMLVDSLGDIVITNDGATILDEMDVKHPAAKMMVQVAKAQDDEVGDGTTSAVIIAGQLLKGSEELLESKIHPTTIVAGLKKAATKATEILDNMAVDIDPEDVATLKKVAMTAMNSKSIAGSKDLFADITAKAIGLVKEDRNGKLVADLDHVSIVKKQGMGLTDTELVRGMVIDKEILHPAMPRRVTNARIAILDAALEIEKTEFDAEIRISDPFQVKALMEEEDRMLKSLAEKVINTGANVLLCQKGIEDDIVGFLAKAGILSVRRVKKSDMKRLARATGGRIVSNVKELSADVLGSAGVVEEATLGDDKMVYIRDCADPKAVTVVIRGGSSQVVDEAERALHDALCVVRNAVQDKKIVAGGGAPEIEVAKGLREYAGTIGGREQIAIEIFADALETIPKTLGENAGWDPITIIVELRAKHETPEGKWFGINVYTGKPSDMMSEGVIEPLSVKKQAIKSASEAAHMILRIDDVIASKAERGPPMPPGGMGGMPPGMGGMGGMPGMM